MNIEHEYDAIPEEDITAYEKVGAPIARTNNGGVLWEFPNWTTGIISKDNASYLCKVALGQLTPDDRKIEFITL